MLHSNTPLWRRGAALLVLAGAIASTQASAQDAATDIAEPAEPASPAVPPVPPVPRVPPVPPAPVAGAHRLTNTSTITLLSDDRRNASVLFEKSSTNMYGSSDDLREARRARHGDETLWWIRRDGKRYVVRDAATIQQLKAAYAPVEALGRQQGELGERQGRLGTRQGEIGRQQGAIAQGQAGQAMEEARRASEQARLAASGGQAAARSAARTDAAHADFAQQMAALETRQSALAEQQEVLARQQEVLAKRQQVANATLQRDIERITRQAIAQGVAQPLPQ
ncbi:hypothetical protein [Xanthomonas bonasiae]|uniref:hypothetical protein n=1 Tax=Xanthomonas bonasiae TaxID=2810351 RepID=UPI00198086E6|nr:hypothetical protein [Xanthomonas bonasiae]MBN6114018.1 hypothetical protein [Xanthomonas bonasiae]